MQQPMQMVPMQMGPNGQMMPMMPAPVMMCDPNTGMMFPMMMANPMGHYPAHGQMNPYGHPHNQAMVPANAYPGPHAAGSSNMYNGGSGSNNMSAHSMLTQASQSALYYAAKSQESAAQLYSEDGECGLLRMPPSSAEYKKKNSKGD